MPDLERIRDEMNERIAELRPAVQELERLEAAVAALSDSMPASNGAAAAAPAAPRRRGRPPGSGRTRKARRPAAKGANGRRTRSSGRPKGSGQRAAQALEIVTAQPGIAIPEIAAAVGIKQNYLYRVMPALEAEGKVVKRGRGWHPKG